MTCLYRNKWIDDIGHQPGVDMAQGVCHAPYAFVGVDYETRTYISEKIALFGSADDFAGTGN